MSSTHEELVKNGSWLFRWRSYLPLVLLLIIIPAFNGYSYPFGSHTSALIWGLFCLKISFLGLLIRCFTIGYTPANTSGRNTKVGQVADSLNTEGIYSVVRNPLYLGNFIIILGIMLFSGVWWSSLMYAIVFWLYYERIIVAEEFYLQGKFGKPYDSYCFNTPIFIPNLKLWKKPTLPFSFKNVLKREYPGFFGIVVSFTILELISVYIVEGHIFLSKIWIGLFIFSLLIYVTLRSLKKYTKLLQVEGR